MGALILVSSIPLEMPVTRHIHLPPRLFHSVAGDAHLSLPIIVNVSLHEVVLKCFYGISHIHNLP